MSDLSLGGPGGLNWSNPSPVYILGEYRSNGMLFYGVHPVTVADFEALNAYMNGNPYSVDRRTLKGRYHPDWKTYGDVVSRSDPKFRSGGLGSDIYELQKVGSGVQFRTDPMWYTNKQGVFVNGVPGDIGEYHGIEDGGYMDYFEGPEPGSPAAEILGDGAYFWDIDNGWYAVR